MKGLDGGEHGQDLLFVGEVALVRDEGPWIAGTLAFSRQFLGERKEGRKQPSASDSRGEGYPAICLKTHPRVSKTRQLLSEPILTAGTREKLLEMLIKKRRSIDIHESMSAAASKLLNLRTHSMLIHHPRQYRSR